MKLAGYFCLIGLVLFITGCASPKIYKEAGVEIKNYGELYFIQPTNDPRKVAPKVVSEFEKIGFNVRLIDPEKPIEGTQGTGFIVSNSGHILTCAHVIGDEKEATVWVQGKRFETDVVAMDKELDLALLSTRDNFNQSILPLKFRQSIKPKMGEDIYTIGYPMSNLLGNSARLSKGLVSSTKGLEDDPNQIQISAEIQPGNSGGPLFDDKGRVLAVVQQTLNPLKMLQQTGGALPQNVNFGIKSDIVVEFIESNSNIDSKKLVANDEFDFEIIEKSVVKVKSGIIAEELENMPKLVARLNYESFWDLWFRFRYLLLSFYDFDSQKFLFSAGQVGDNFASSENTAITETFIKIKETLNK